MSNLPTKLAEYQEKGYVVAPAGFGKTHLIAEATAKSTGRQLILTHTYAGVDALRSKMRALGVSSRLYRIDTIASWSLRLALSYSTTSGWTVKFPDNQEWEKLYKASTCLLKHKFIREIVKASYAGLYVDEYQDCSLVQHDIVCSLADYLPCRILGDPLQGIFGFRGQESIDWKRNVEDCFADLGKLEIPYRWKLAGADELGEWLQKTIRRNLEQNQPIKLNENLPDSVRFEQVGADTGALSKKQSNTCRFFGSDKSHTVIAIHKGINKAQCHKLSNQLSGDFSSLEEIEGKDLFSFTKEIDLAQTGSDRLKKTVVFAKKCMIAVNENLSAETIRGDQVKNCNKKRNSQAACMANNYLNKLTSDAMCSFLLEIEKINDVKVYRSDLFNRIIEVLRKHARHPELSLTEAAEKYHAEFRYKGRPVRRRKLIGTTLLVKGLEFDHAIILDAASLSKKELYVALTRGMRSLTIISTNPVLTPED